MEQNLTWPPAFQLFQPCLDLARSGMAQLSLASSSVALLQRAPDRAAATTVRHAPAAPHARPPGPSFPWLPKGRREDHGQAFAQQLHAVEAPHNLSEAVLPHGEGGVQGGAAPLAARLPALAARLGSMLQPQGETGNDNCPYERALNVVTSLPFLAIGLHMHSRRQAPEARHHAASVVAVGAAASLYHATYGRARPVARKIDYWTIAFSSSALVKSLYADKPWVVRASNLSLLAVPFRPFLVSTAHTLVMQGEFARQAMKHESVRKDFTVHAATAAAGTVMFAVEDALLDRGFGLAHALWHCLACAAVGTTSGLVAHKERQLLARRRRHSGALVHSSASSLAGLSRHGSGGKGGK